MAGLGAKIKDALTPGHRHHGDRNHDGIPDKYQRGMDYNHDGIPDTSYTAHTGVATTTTSVQPGVVGVPAAVVAPIEASYTTDRSDLRAVERISTTSSESSGAIVHTRIGEDICNRREFVEVEDRPIVKERVERVVEHRPVEKHYVVETRAVGESELREGRAIESLGVTERVIDRAVGTKCPTNTVL